MKVYTQIFGIISRAALVLRGAGWERMTILPQRIRLEVRVVAEAVVGSIWALRYTTIEVGSDAIA